MKEAKTNTNPPDQNLILDMDETLLHFIAGVTNEVWHQLDSRTDLAGRLHSVILEDSMMPQGTGATERIVFVERPYLHEFLIRAKDRFKRIFLWSAGQKEYVERSVQHILRIIRKVDDVLTNEDCVLRDDGLLAKPIGKLTSKYPDVTQTNTFIIDDRETAFDLDDPKNGIVIPAFEPTLADLMDLSHPCHIDTALLRVLEFCDRETTIWTTDVRELSMEPAIPPKGEMVQIFCEKCDSDGIFQCIAKGILNSDLARLLAEKLVEICYIRNRKLPPNGHLINSATLRMVLTQTLMDDKDTRDEFVKKCLENKEAWIEPALRQGGYKVEVLLQLIQDKMLFHGNITSIQILGHALQLNIGLVDEDWSAINTLNPSFPLANIHLRIEQNSCALIIFTSKYDF